MKRKIYLYGISIVLLMFAWLFSGSSDNTQEFAEKVKVSLREVGDELLRANHDSTSLVLPVVALERSKYQLSFEKDLSLDPASLVAAIDTSFKKAALSKNYLVEVNHCTDKEVAYSYEMNIGVEKTLIPCQGRVLPQGCYTIMVRFTDRSQAGSGSNWLLYLVFFIGIFAFFDLYLSRKKQPSSVAESEDPYSDLGSFRFYPEQNKLVKQAMEINLSKKEGELLAIFIAQPNKVIKRDELTKRVWEDKGVIVGRSLDTYISKLRKKLQEDESIKLTNIHGVGYKLEILD